MRTYKSLWLSLILVTSLFFSFQIAHAEESMTYTGLSAKKARFKMSRRSLFLKPGETAPNGAKLVSADENSAVISLSGNLYSYSKGSSTPKPLPSKVILTRSGDGIFHTKGSINGKPFHFMVDTGATSVAMNSRDARKLKLKYKKGKKIKVSTASKVETAYVVKLDSVRVGGLYATDVHATVLEGKFPEVVLLGNTFLHKFNIFTRGNSLIMTAR
ncbi:TIGR02281 family clan AA aspartic protease [Thermodesulfobacteriota bacterium]